MKLKVWDKVRVREGLEIDKEYGECNYFGHMELEKWKEYTITHVDYSNYELDNWYEYYTDEMVELVEGSKKLEEFKKWNMVLDLDWHEVELMFDYWKKDKSGDRYVVLDNWSLYFRQTIKRIPKKEPIKEYTMKELQEKLGESFKLIK